MKKRGTQKWQKATTVRRRKIHGEWVSNGELYRSIDAGYAYFLAERTRTAALRSAENRMTFSTTHEHHQSYPVAPRA